LRELLEESLLPRQLVEEVLSQTNTLWLLGVPDEQVASELAMCHPPLRVGEVRAVINETAEAAGRDSLWRITVAAHDRPGLLACTAGTLTQAGFSIVDVAATVLPRSRTALQRLTVTAPPGEGLDGPAWNAFARRLRHNLASGEHLAPLTFKPKGPVLVEVQPQELGRTVVTIEAPDQIGLLHAAANWLEAAGCNVEGARASSTGGRARGVLIVSGPVDTAALAAALSGPISNSPLAWIATTPLHFALDVAERALGFGLGALRAVGGLVSRAARHRERGAGGEWCRRGASART
jgi:UTP:GlnB (protein PII) uridylyltransferase